MRVSLVECERETRERGRDMKKERFGHESLFG